MMTRYGVPRDIRERVLNHGGKRSGSVNEVGVLLVRLRRREARGPGAVGDALSCIVEGRRAEIEDYSGRLARYGARQRSSSLELVRE